MKILFFIDCLTSGGKERRLVELMKGLKLLPEVQFELVIMSEDVHYKEVFELGITIHYLIRRSKKDFSAFYKFYKISKIYRPDFIHCWDSMTAVLSVPICILLQIRMVNGMITDTPLQRNIFYKPLLRARLTFPFSNIIIGNSNAGLKAYSAPKRKSFVIYNGFNFVRINGLLEKSVILKKIGVKSKYVVGMVAAFGEFKDYKTYFEAAQLLLKNRDDVTFLAIGNNTDSEQSESLILKENKANFKLLGKQSGIESYINAMDICVLSTYSEGVSNSILEYMALSKPVIVTAGGGSNEIVVNATTGFLISQSNSLELCDKIELLINDDQLRQRMGYEGKERIINHFSIEKMVDSFVDIYSRFLYTK
jgi:glycosyltransferase involved in cell wall biosynthesis